MKNLLILLPVTLSLALGAADAIVGEPVFNGKPLSYWVQGLTMASWRPGKPKREEAIQAIQSLGPPAVPFLLQFHADPWYLQQEAVRDATAALVLESPFSNQVCQLVVQSLGNTNATVRENALYSLTAQDAQVPGTIRTVRSLLQDKSARVRRAAQDTVIRCGVPASMEYAP